jgi:simple sugar transport system permease protein
MRNLIEAYRKTFGTEVAALLGFLLMVLVVFSLTAPRFLSGANFGSMAFQLPELGLLTLAMLAPIISGGLNLAIIYTANMAGLTLAWVLLQFGGIDAGPGAFVLGVAAALAVGAAAGAIMGLVIAYIGAHPILVSLAMMIFLRGLGEFLTRGGDISGFPTYLAPIGHGSVLGVPVPMLIFLAAALVWHVLLGRTRHGFSVYMIGSNIRASVRVGHGEALLLITVLACFLGGVDPFGGFGKVAPVVLALMILQVLSSGLNLLGANQHLSTAVWGLFLICVMVLRWVGARLTQMQKRKGE